MNPPSIQCGDVVFIKDVPDENGVNQKTRRCVVIAIAGQFAKVLAATSTFNTEPHFIELPYHRDGHPRTTFTKPTAVNLYWDQCVPLSECRKVGFVPAMKLMQIIRRLEVINPLDDWREDPA